jgi:hypothetical protein
MPVPRQWTRDDAAQVIQVVGMLIVGIFINDLSRMLARMVFFWALSVWMYAPPVVRWLAVQERRAVNH